MTLKTKFKCNFQFSLAYTKKKTVERERECCTFIKRVAFSCSVREGKRRYERTCDVKDVERYFFRLGAKIVFFSVWFHWNLFRINVQVHSFVRYFNRFYLENEMCTYIVLLVNATFNFKLILFVVFGKNSSCKACYKLLQEIEWRKFHTVVCRYIDKQHQGWIYRFMRLVVV